MGQLSAPHAPRDQPVEAARRRVADHRRRGSASRHRSSAPGASTHGGRGASARRAGGAHAVGARGDVLPARRCAEVQRRGGQADAHEQGGCTPAPARCARVREGARRRPRRACGRRRGRMTWVQALGIVEARRSIDINDSADLGGPGGVIPGLFLDSTPALSQKNSRFLGRGETHG